MSGEHVSTLSVPHANPFAERDDTLELRFPGFHNDPASRPAQYRVLTLQPGGA
jgi:hypothetical protein